VVALAWTAAEWTATATDGLVWEACPDRPVVECAQLDVPLDRGSRDAPSISLAVRRLPATDSEARLGVLVVLAGGPGQRGSDWVAAEAHDPEIASRFDIVSLDPRGTSGETAVTCIPLWDPFGGLDRTPDDDAERRALDERIRELAAGCRERHADVLPHLGTGETVEDVEALRLALGEERLSLMGWSYGTRVALRYASAYPEHTRSVVLDGFSDPNRSPAERELEQAAAFERQLEELLVECALRDDCPLGGTEPGTRLDQLLERLDEAPVPAGAGRVLRQSDAYEAIAGSLVRGRRDRERLLDALAAADRGDGRALLAIADETRTAFEASGLDLGTFAAIVCADDGAFWAAMSPAEVSELTTRTLEAAPRLGAWLWSPPAADDLPPVGLCAMTPGLTSHARGSYDAAGAGPILVLAASGDPTTPLAGAVRATAELADARLLTVRGDGHVLYPVAVAAPSAPASRCLLEAVREHLVQGQTPGQRSCP
jgi:pimeloyl-ACP methyl ester carboxylesterase